MKKFSSLVLAVIMVFAVLPFTVSAEDSVMPISECGGVISSGKTYSISTAEEFLLFERMNSDCDGAKIILTNDITIHDGIFTVDENQEPMYNGSFTLPESIEPIDIFCGMFDGQGYTISGLFIKGSNAGLVNWLYDDGSVSNVSIENSLFYSKLDSGSICAACDQSAEVKNCFSDAVVIGNEGVGGIVGNCQDGTIKDCYFNGTVIADEKNNGWIGGIVGMGCGTFLNCVNAGDVYDAGSNIYARVGGFAGCLLGQAQNCANTGNVYAKRRAAGFVGEMYDGSVCLSSYNAGKVYAETADNFLSLGYVSFRDFKECYFLGEEGDSAGDGGSIEEEYARYLATIIPDPYGMPQIVDDIGVRPLSEKALKSNGSGYLYYHGEFVVDKGNENHGYPIPESLQRRTVAPSITNVEYEKSSETRNTFNVTVEGRPAMIQFIEPTNGTRTYDRNHKNVTIKSYDADGNEVNSLDRTAAYEVWSIYSNMMPNVEIRTRAKYLSEAIYTWDSETYDFPMILANPIVSMELASYKGAKGAVPATVVADNKTEKVMFKMPNDTSVTVSTYTTDEKGNRVFTGKAWMNQEGLNEIRVLIYRDNVWKLAGALEYTVS